MTPYAQPYQQRFIFALLKMGADHLALCWHHAHKSKGQLCFAQTILTHFNVAKTNRWVRQASCYSLSLQGRRPHTVRATYCSSTAGYGFLPRSKIRLHHIYIAVSTDVSTDVLLVTLSDLMWGMMICEGPSSSKSQSNALEICYDVSCT